MASQGDVIENLLTGETVIFLETRRTRTASCYGSSTSFRPVSPSPNTSTRTRGAARDPLGDAQGPGGRTGAGL
jgi:hypothetical protein